MLKRILYACQVCGEEWGEGESCPNACRTKNGRFAEGDPIGECPDDSGCEEDQDGVVY